MATPWERTTDESCKQWLINRQLVAEEFNQASLVERSTLRDQFEQQQQQLSGVDCKGRFLGLLSSSGISAIDNSLMNILLKHFSSNLLVASTPDEARDLCPSQEQRTKLSNVPCRLL